MISITSQINYCLLDPFRNDRVLPALYFRRFAVPVKVHFSADIFVYP